MANCSHCGSELTAGVRFCETCGRPVAVAAVVAAAAPEIMPLDSSASSLASPRARGYRFWLNAVTLVGAIVWAIAPWWALWVLYTTKARFGSLTNTELLSIQMGIFFASAGIVLVVGLAVIVAAVTSTTSIAKKLTGSLLGFVFIGIGVWSAIDPWAFLSFEQLAPVHIFLLLLLFFAWGIPRPFRGPGYFSLLVGVPILVIVVGLIFVPMLGWQIGLSPIVRQVVFSVLIAGAIVVSVWLSVVLEARQPRVTPAVVGGYSAASGIYAPRTNILAVLSLIFGILGVSIVAIVVGHIGLAQIRRTGESGRGMAIAGLVLGYAALLAVVGYLVVVLVMLF